MLLLSYILTVFPTDTRSYICKALVCGLSVTVIAFYIALRTFGNNLVYIGTGATLRRVFDSMRTAHRPPRPPFWAYNCHIQFVPWIIYNLIAASLAPLRYEAQVVRVHGLEDKTKPEA